MPRPLGFTKNPKSALTSILCEAHTRVQLSPTAAISRFKTFDSAFWTLTSFYNKIINPPCHVPWGPPRTQNQLVLALKLCYTNGIGLNTLLNQEKVYLALQSGWLVTKMKMLMMMSTVWWGDGCGHQKCRQLLHRGGIKTNMSLSCRILDRIL